MFYGKTLKMSKCAIFKFQFLCVKSKNGHFKMSKSKKIEDELKKIKNHQKFYKQLCYDKR